MHRPGVVSLVALALAAIGCGLQLDLPRNDGGVSSTSPSVAEPPSDRLDDSTGSCAVGAPSLAGARGPGQACASADDCAPTCCSCGDGVHGWRAASCIDGRCTDGATTCTRTARSARSCPGVRVPVGDLCGYVGFASAPCDACFRMHCCADGATCAGNAACIALRDCYGGCVDDGCAARCADAHPSGQSELEHLNGCMQSWCRSACE